MRIIGEVINGLGRAARLGFPTANIPVGPEILADFDGVYAGLTFVDDVHHPSVIFFDTRRELLESHMLDMDADVRGKTLEVEIVDKIRDTQQFPHDSELIEQIRLDINTAQNILND
jgi:FAD synthase